MLPPYHSTAFFNTNTYQPLPQGKELVFVGWQMKTPENIGGLIRTAANIGIKDVIVVSSVDNYFNGTKIRRVARSAYDFVNLKYASEDELWQLIDSSFITVALETSPASTNIFTTSLPDKLALFLGNEQDGLPQLVIDRCQQQVHIPMTGPVKSMNVSHAATVAAFEWLRQKMS